LIWLIDIFRQADVSLIYFLNVGLRNPVFDFVMPAFDSGSAWRLPILLAWLALMVFGGRRGRLLGLGALVLVALTDPIASRIIKPLVARVRPCNVLPGLYLWKDGAWIILPDTVIEIYRGSYSMPSSHAVNAGAQALWWGWAYPRLRWFWWGLGIVIGYSRIYDGVHWPSDVLVGWLLGAAIFIIVMAAWGKWVILGRGTVKGSSSA
jgi:undecaprenyl-diphosphatase